MVLSPQGKLDLAARIDEIRSELLFEIGDETYLDDERDWLRQLIPSLDYASDLIGENGCLAAHNNKSWSATLHPDKHQQGA